MIIDVQLPNESEPNKHRSQYAYYVREGFVLLMCK